MVQVRRRRVFFIEGYEPQGAEGFHRMFRREWRRFRDNWGVSGTLQDIQIKSDDIASWEIETNGPNWQVSTTYEFLRLENFIRANLAQPLWRQLARAFRWIADDIASGALRRVFRASWRMGVLLIYSQVFLLLWIGAAIVGGAYLARLVLPSDQSTIVVAATAIAAAFGLFHLMRPVIDAMFVNQLNNCWPYLREFARGEPTGFDHLLDLYAERITAAAYENDVDEILVVGHSAGAMLALTVMERALRTDPEIGRQRAPISIVTVGSIMPSLAMHPAAQSLRNTIMIIATEPSLVWADCQSRDDFMNFWEFDPVSGVGIDPGPARCNPQICPVVYHDMIATDVFKSVRYNYWRMHYQYIMSNDRRAPFDYYMFVCGPAPLSFWLSRNDFVNDAFAADGTYRIKALKAAE